MSHTLLSGVVQVCHELLVGEERKRKRNRDGRKRRKYKEKVKAKRTHAHVDDHVDGMKGETQT